MIDPIPAASAATAVGDYAKRTEGGGIRVRPLRSIEDLHACVALQRHVWGWDQADVVPATLLHIVEYVGGLVAGAFDADDTLVGFVFGISGVRTGQLAHWSHMLGVRESARNMGVGRMLKEYQRATLAALGIGQIYWSFDPLMTKNAYFNLNRLGAEVVEYVPDMYGTTESPLHFGLATDRLVVRLSTSEAAVRAVHAPVQEGLPILTPFPRLNDVTMSIGDRTPERALIEIPADILDVIARAPLAARTWRLAIRDHMQWALARHYRISGVHVSAPSGRSFYLITRDADMDRAASPTAPTHATRESPA
jgi:predicted GNAT superfamily acetyltransferase